MEGYSRQNGSGAERRASFWPARCLRGVDVEVEIEGDLRASVAQGTRSEKFVGSLGNVGAKSLNAERTGIYLGNI